MLNELGDPSLPPPPPSFQAQCPRSRRQRVHSRRCLRHRALHSPGRQATLNFPRQERSKNPPSDFQVALQPGVRVRWINPNGQDRPAVTRDAYIRSCGPCCSICTPRPVEPAWESRRWESAALVENSWAEVSLSRNSRHSFQPKESAISAESLLIFLRGLLDTQIESWLLRRGYRPQR